MGNSFKFITLSIATSSVSLFLSLLISRLAGLPTYTSVKVTLTFSVIMFLTVVLGYVQHKLDFKVFPKWLIRYSVLFTAGVLIPGTFIALTAALFLGIFFLLEYIN